uniref:R3H domain and coiled-coil containing 1 n=1 Tax=Sphenodon punctatus TaxID=8508 RepID=A0A8D0H7S2_SPHPU
MRKKPEGLRNEALEALGTEPVGDVVSEEGSCTADCTTDGCKSLADTTRPTSSVSPDVEFPSTLDPREMHEEHCMGDNKSHHCPVDCSAVPVLECSQNLSTLEDQDKDALAAITVGCSQNLSLSEEKGKEHTDTIALKRSKDHNRDVVDAIVLEHSDNQSLPEDQSEDRALASELEERKNLPHLEDQNEDTVDASVSKQSENLSLLENQDTDCTDATGLECSQDHSITEAQDDSSIEAPVLEDDMNSSLPSGQSLSCTDTSILDHGKNVFLLEDQEKVHRDQADTLQSGLELSAGDGGLESSTVDEEKDGNFEDDCGAELLQEITNYLTVKDISIEKIQFDYSSYGEAQINEGDFGHVIEIYDFSPSLKTDHLMEAFSEFQDSGFKLQWVDDTHALGVFSSLAAASQALGQIYPSLKIRPLIQGTRQSKIKALQRPTYGDLTDCIQILYTFLATSIGEMQNFTHFYSIPES